MKKTFWRIPTYIDTDNLGAKYEELSLKGKFLVVIIFFLNYLNSTIFIKIA